MDLDALLSESVELKQKEKDAKTEGMRKKKAIDSTWLSNEEKKALEAAKERIHVAADGWVNEAVVLMLSKQVCSGCGATHFQTEGRFLLKSYKKYNAKNYERILFDWERIELPRKVKINIINTDICIECLQNFCPDDFLED